MTKYTSSNTSPLNTALIDPIGNIAYEVSTPFRLSNWETTDKRGDKVIATIQWKIFQRSTLTMGGKSGTIKEVFPKSKKMSKSRIFTMPNGEQFKWKDSSEFNCVSLDSGFNLATYHRNSLSIFRSKQSVLDILHDEDIGQTDALVVTWVIAEKEAMDRRRGVSGG